MRDVDRDLVKELVDSERDASELAFAIITTEAPFQVGETQMQEVYQTLGYWYARCKDKKRRSQGEEKLKWQLREDLLEAWVKGMNLALMTRLHLNKLTERMS